MKAYLHVQNTHAQNTNYKIHMYKIRIRSCEHKFETIRITGRHMLFQAFYSIKLTMNG